MKELIRKEQTNECHTQRKRINRAWFLHAFYMYLHGSHSTVWLVSTRYSFYDRNYLPFPT